jgi:thiol:disulfide interchange protein DsbD
MQLVKRVVLLLGMVCTAVSALAANTTVRLFLSHEAAKPGETIWAAVEMRMAPRWHTYWSNAGESGDATKIQWTLPQGVTAADILWPVPEKYVSAGLTTFVYHNKAVLLIPISTTAKAPSGSVELKANVNWLECEELCVPGKGEVAAKLIIGNESKPSKDAALIEAAKKKLPQPKPASYARAWWEKEASGDARPLLIEWTPGPQAKQADFFPLAATNFVVKPATEKVTFDADKVRIRKEVEKLDGWPSDVGGLLIEQDANGELLAAYQVKLPIEGSSAAASAADGKTSRAGASAAVLPKLETKSFAAWLGLAFLGGLILNLMPCVLPVIALKIFGFLAQSHESPARVRQLGIIYGVGVLFSFMVLAGIVIGVQSASKQASWGMQFGNPYFVVGMTVLITLVALNFFGMFEVTLGGSTIGAAAELASREGASGAFFNGVLATVLATPCTAPFLAPALGFAFAQPPAVIVVMFAAVAAGLAAPYVVLSFQPGWLKFLPKPGEWMENFKIAMGFPLMATALWLLSIVSRHYGPRGVLWVGIFLVFVAIAAWIYGEFVQRGSRRKALATGVSLLFLVGGYALALESQLNWRSKRLPSAGAGLIENSSEPDGIQWKPWSSEAVEMARKEGRPVFVDFTADWCLTCQANKKYSIEIPSTRKKLKEINAVALLGDYTLVPDDLTAELKRYGRAGVPLVLVYPRDASKQAIVLPALLTPSIVLEALDQAAR